MSVCPDVSTRRLCLLFTPASCRADPWQTLRDAIAGGVDLVQWRVKHTDRAGLAQCLAICAEAGVPVIVNDQVDLAVAAGAAGAHVGQDDMPAGAARLALGDRLLGVSTHDLDQARRAVAAGADYIGLGPCFPTTTKGYTTALPRDLIRTVTRTIDLPIFAIGGITPDNLAELTTLGIRRIAVSQAILAARDPAATAHHLAKL